MKKNKIPVPGMEQLHAAVDQMARELLCRKGPRGSGGQTVKHECSMTL